MSSKRKLERNFSDNDKNSDSNDEMEDFVLRKPKQKKKCLDSGSESESSCLEQNIPKYDEESDAISLRDEPLKNKAKNVKVHSSDGSLEGKTLPTEKKYSSVDSSGSEASNVSSDEIRLKDSSDDEDKPISNVIKKKASKFKHRPSGTSDEEEPISNIMKKKASKIKNRSKKAKPCSSDSSEDEPLANKHRKSFENSNSQSMTKDLQSESDDEFVVTSNKKKISESATSTKLKSVHTSGSSSDDEPLALKSKNSSRKRKASGILSDEVRSKDTSDDDDEPISNVLKKEASKIKDRSKEMKPCTSDSSEDEPLAKHGKSSASSNNKMSTLTDHHSEYKDGSEVSSDEDSSDEIIKSSKTNRKPKADSSVNDSEEEFLTVKSKSSKQKPNGRETKSKSVTGDISSDDEEKSSDSLSKVKEKADKKKVNKEKNSSNGKIEHLKKYLRVAGIHVNSYNKLFEDCKSIKSKVEKLLGLLREKGLKGRPTIEKCKKLKKKIETKKEIAELDLSNIIKSEGRPKRGSGEKIEKTQKTKSSPAGKKFMRLHDIIDSEGSD